VAAVADAEARAHVFVADPDVPELADADRHHLERVLRLRPGDPVTVADGAGRWRLCRLAGGVDGAALEPAGEVETEARLEPPVTVAFALTKGERPEWTVQKLTELGVDGIVPFVAERSVVRWDAGRAATHSERWRRIAREAACQSRRAWLPVVEDVAPFAGVAGRAGAALAERGGGPPSLAWPLVLVGPEGGWSPAERAVAEALPRVGFAAPVLRAETAAVTAGAVLCALRLGVVAPAGREGGPESPR
jgi:16S rRNA (uracil1498-N3)-methyltransferase